uniref:ATP synthase complex subunit 8 n=1 Tax=Curculionoidea sp. 29 KM-2017 TaxID=2219413 RepID=A0A346RID6_9CUCU|nr:ATP synthase F0 subunit 8 [Curculionoidea sp. 29 KM-2017]
MPQMAPMNWLMLFIYFLILLMLLTSMNYYFYLYYPKKFINMKKNIITNWKW